MIDTVMNADDGGQPARRAVVRWAWRLFRREWRQQVLVLALLTLTVATAVGAASAVYNVAPGPANAEFGTANHFIRFDDASPDVRSAQTAAAFDHFGLIDVIGHRSVPVPGVVDPLDYRAQDPDGPYGGLMLDLREGRYPRSEGEVAVTDRVARDFDLGIGSGFGLDGVERTVVGFVENPSALADEFALLAPSTVGASESLTILVSATSAEVESFRAPGDTSRITSSRGDIAEDVVAAVAVLAVGAIALLFVALVASASFMVLAQRRQRQLGMISAIGATEKHLQLALVAHGVLVGLTSAVLGATIGLIGWLTIAPRVEQAVGFRIDPLNVPWWLVVVALLLAIVASTGASFWPARTAARLPTVQALSGRPPTPLTVRRSAGVAAMFLAGGLVCLAISGPVANETSLSITNSFLIATGTVSTVTGVLLVSPLLVRLLGRFAAAFPIALRLPLRDLSRYQARSGAALAAISLAIGIPVAIVAIASAALYTEQSGNLSDRQLLVGSAVVDGPFIPAQADMPALNAGVDRLAAALDHPTVTVLEVALDELLESTEEGREVVSLAVEDGDGSRDVSKVYLATAELLAPYGVSPEATDPSSGILTVQTDDVFFVGVSLPEDAERRDLEYVTSTGTLEPSYTSLPSTFMTSEELNARGWVAAPSGQWLIQLNEPITDDQIGTAREIAAAAGLTVERRDSQVGLGRLRTGATVTGILLALGVLAMTVGLVRGEAAGDVRILTASGASDFTRRTLTAAAAAALALLGVGLGTLGAYTALAASDVNGIRNLSTIPYTQLTAIALGTPLAALIAGWLLAGREPRAVARRVPLE